MHRLLRVVLLLTCFAGTSVRAQDLPPLTHDLFTGPERPLEAHPFDQRHIRIDVRVLPEEGTVVGMAELEIAPLEPLQEIHLMSADSRVDSIFVSVGQERYPVAFEQRGRDSLVIALSPLALSADTLAAVDSLSLSDSLRADSLLAEAEIASVEAEPLAEPFRITVHYAAQPTMGLYFVPPYDDEEAELIQVWTQGETEGNRHWIPVYDHPSDKLTSELIITIDSAYAVASNGILQQERLNEDGTRTFHYAQTDPHTSYLIAFAADRYEAVRQSVTLANGRRLPTTYWVLPERVQDVERTLGRTPAMLTFYEELLGVRYPWPKYDQIFVRDFMWGGMENTGATILTDRTLIDERAALDYDPDNLVAHELVHQWFGNLITAQHWSEVWLQEAFAMQLAAMWLEHDRGREHYLLHMLRRADPYFREARDYLRPIVWSRWVSPLDMFDRHTYDKGGWVLHMLRAQVGDELYAAILQQQLREHAYGSVTTPDFQQVVEDVTNRSWDRFFDQWVHQAGHPVVDVTYSHDASSGKLRVVLRQTQEYDLVPRAFSFPLTLEIQTLGGAARHEVMITEREHDFTFDVAMPPRYVLPDPDFNLLAEFHVQQPASAWVSQLRQALEPVSRQLAARALAAYVDQPALLVGLRGAFEVEQSPDVRAEIIRTVAQLPDDASKERVLLSATNDDDADVREAAVRALGTAEGSADAAARLLEMAHSEPSYQTQAQAVLSLARIDAGEADGIVESALITPSFREYVRHAAFDALPHLGVSAAEGMRTAARFLASGTPTDARIAAIEYLAVLAQEQPRAIGPIIEMLSDDLFRVRNAAAIALAKVGDDRAREALESRLESEPEPALQRRIRRSIEQWEQAFGS